MPSHVLRSFSYLDHQTLNDYLAALGLAIQDESIKATSEKASSISGEGSVSILKSGGKSDSKEVTETTKQVIYTDAAKFQMLYAQLEQEEDGFGYYETMDDESWGNIGRNDIIEVAVDLSLTKIATMSVATNEISRLANLAELFSGEVLLDAKTKQIITAIELLAQMETETGIPVIMSVLNSPNYKLVSYLNPDFLRVEKSRLSGEATVFCKVQRKLQDREKYDLFDPLKAIAQVPMNRKQRRASAKSRKPTEFPADLRDTIKAPGAIITPIAVYR